LQVFHGRFGDLCCFVAILIMLNLCFFGANIFGPNLHRCYSNFFFHICHCWAPLSSS